MFLSSLAFGQDIEKTNSLNKNCISLNPGSMILINGIGLSYQRIFPKVINFLRFEQANSVVSLGANIVHFENYLAHLYVGPRQINRYIIPHISYGLINNVERDHHIEIYIGISYRHEISYYFSSKPNKILPLFKLGYRYQAPQKNLVFTSGLGSVEGLYIGLGCAF